MKVVRVRHQLGRDVSLPNLEIPEARHINRLPQADGCFKCFAFLSPGKTCLTFRWCGVGETMTRILGALMCNGFCSEANKCQT